PDDRKKIAPFSGISQMASGSNVEYRIIKGDKSIHWIRERRFPVYGKDNNVVRIAGLWTDISTFKEAAEKEKRHREQLQQADKMASLGVLVSGVAHEVNNPNNFIMLNAPLLRETWEDAKPILALHYEKNRNFEMGGLPYPEIAETIPKLFDGIERGAQRIKCIVEDLKNYARQDTCNYTNIVNINQVVREAASLLKSLIEKSTDSFSMHLSSNDVLIQGNKQKLEQVVINLIQNACYALKEKGEAITVTVDTIGETCEIRVIDEGVGIPKAHLSQLTDPFFTTRRNSGGTGLGLSVSAGIVKEHRGTMVFDSKKGVGTTVKVNLPLTRKKAIAE
ncbi:MAG: PAS domain-containing sensor histidine kinase, partial [Chitinivibrionales bacterium]|nr:PAS domain-containing sensor histidine kinase [Chitinivibrionales bacterium]